MLQAQADAIEARLHGSVGEIDAQAWDVLRGDDDPFTSHAFLAGLEQTGCLRADFGWHAGALGLYQGGRLIAACPLYRKTNSHGEFVFDFAWADAYARHGLPYYPKLLCAVPYTPVGGPRLLVGTEAGADARRTLLAQALDAELGASGLSSAHVNFCHEADADALRQQSWLERFDWQYHWTRRGWTSFDDFLCALKPKKRRNIQQEREHVARAGVHCEIRHGDELDSGDWRDLHRLYLGTFALHGNHAALTLAFFRHLGQAMPRQVVAVLCRHAGRTVAAALCLRSASTLYGRYWGADIDLPGLHFEACYYQGIDYCIRHGLQRFEPGAQGRHKIARGFLPTRTRSFHRIADPRFAAAIANALQREAVALHDYRRQLLEHNPYRDAQA